MAEARTSRSVQAYARGATIALWLQVIVAAFALGTSIWLGIRIAKQTAESKRLEGEADTLREEVAHLQEDLAKSTGRLQRSRELIPLVSQAVELYHLQRFGAAVAMYDEALALDPHNPYIANLRGYSLLKAGRLDEAVASLQLAVELDPGYGWGYMDLARALCAKHDYDAALAAATRAVHLRNDLFLAMRNDSGFQKQCAPIAGQIPQEPR